MKMKQLISSIFLVSFLHCSRALPLPTRCEDVLPAWQCSELRGIAVDLKQPKEVVDESVKEYVKNKGEDLKECYQYTRDKIVELAEKYFKCTDALTQKSCDKLSEIAARLRISTDKLTSAIINVIADGAQTAADIYKLTIVYIRDKVANVGCSDFLSQSTCSKLTAMVQLAQLNIAVVNNAVRQAVILGSTTVKEIYNNTIDYLKMEITCDKLLGKGPCDKLREIAKLLGDKSTDVDEAIRAFILAGKTQISEVVGFVKEYLMKIADGFKCTDVISDKICTRLYSIAAHLKLHASEVREALMKAIVAGASTAIEINLHAIGFLKDMVTAVKCEDLLAKDLCTKIEAFANKVHLNMVDIMAAIKNAIGDGVWTTAQLYMKVIEFLKEMISCDRVLGSTLCKVIVRMAELFGVPFKKVTNLLRELVASGVTKVSDLYSAIIKFIKGSIFGDDSMRMLEDESMKEITENVSNFIEALPVAIMQVEDTESNDILSQPFQMMNSMIVNTREHLNNIKNKLLDSESLNIGLSNLWPIIDSMAEDVFEEIREDTAEAMVKLSQHVQEL